MYAKRWCIWLDVNLNEQIIAFILIGMRDSQEPVSVHNCRRLKLTTPLSINFKQV